MVARLNLDGFTVRQHRRAVERFTTPAAWATLDDNTRRELIKAIAPLPFGAAPWNRRGQAIRSADVLAATGPIESSKGFGSLKTQLMEIASCGDSLRARRADTHSRHCATRRADRENPDRSIVGGRYRSAARTGSARRLRDLVQHIERCRKAVVYSNFANEIGDGIEHELPQVGQADFPRFKQKEANEGHITLHKLRHCRPLTATDLDQWEKMLLDAGIAEADDIERARNVSQGFGRFVRSLVGLDRKSVTDAFGGFLNSGTASTAQIEFINMVIEHLTEKGRGHGTRTAL